MSIRPLKDYVLIKLDEQETVTPGGLVLGATVSPFGSKCISGVVVAVGPGGHGYDAGIVDERKPMPKQKRFEVDVEVGERVLIQLNAGEPVDFETTGTAIHPKSATEKHRVVSCNQIEAVLE